MDKKLSEKLHRISNLASEMDALYHQASLRLGVADSTMRVLYTILSNGESCSLSDVYKLSGVNKQTINSAIRKMEGEELLYLEKESGRSKRIVLTVKGKQYMEETAGRLYEMELRSFSSWTPEEIDNYIRLMEQDVNGMKAEVGRL